MLMNMRLMMLSVIALATLLGASALADPPIEASKTQIVVALQNIMTLDRPRQDGLPKLQMATERTRQ
jgi:hypothetical protein